MVQMKNNIVRTNPELASLVSVTLPEVTEIQQLFPSDETLVEYFGSGDTLFVFIVNHDRIRGVKLEVDGLRQKIEVFREHLMIPDTYQFKKDGHKPFMKS